MLLNDPVSRIDLITIILTFITILLMAGGIYTFINITHSSKKIAAEVAKDIAYKQAEEHTNNYIQNNLIAILSAYEHLFKDSISAEATQKISEAQENNED